MSLAPRPDDELVFLPLGGSGEIGMNLNAYGYGPPHARKWIVVDVGVSFGNATLPGVDIIMPDATFLEQVRENILAIVLTHAHEDHIGAIGYIWPKLRVPIYATPFTAVLVREKLKEHGLDQKAKLIEAPLSSHIKIGPFDIDLVTLTHSIPEPNGLAIHTPLGLVWHTGDWKIDPEPLVGAATDETALRALDAKGVLAMVCDSTNVFVEGEAGSEADVRGALIERVRECAGKVAITAFASNVARVESAVEAAKATDRRVCLVGRSMHRIVGAAKAVGVLKNLPNFVSEEEAAYLAPRQVLYICTGSQGEPRAALSRIAAGTHRHVKLGTGDVVLFSSRVIPGNEAAIHALQEQLNDRGVTVITDADWPIHVSGHPCRDELRQMYQWIRPRIAVPVHGERRHLIEHAKLARELQVSETVAPRNGEMIRLAPGPAMVIDEVQAGRRYVDGGAILNSDDDALKDRRRMAAEGAVNVAIAVSGKKHAIVSGPDVRVRGLSMADEDELDLALDRLRDTAEMAFNKLSASERADSDGAEESVMRAVRRAAEKLWGGKRPLVDVSILSL
jgi:ribonuclease J